MRARPGFVLVRASLSFLETVCFGNYYTFLNGICKSKTASLLISPKRANMNEQDNSPSWH